MDPYENDVGVPIVRLICISERSRFRWGQRRAAPPDEPEPLSPTLSPQPIPTLAPVNPNESTAATTTPVSGGKPRDPKAQLLIFRNQAELRDYATRKEASKGYFPVPLCRPSNN